MGAVKNVIKWVILLALFPFHCLLYGAGLLDEHLLYFTGKLIKWANPGLYRSLKPDDGGFL